MNLLEQITRGKIQRKWIFIAMFAVVALPYLFPLGLPIPLSDSTTNLYDILQDIPEGSTVMFSFDFGPGVWAESGPMAVALVNAIFEKNLNIIFVTFVLDGPPMVDRVLKLSKYYDELEYGVDYCNLGYIPGFETGMGAFAADVNIVKVDYNGNQVNDLEIMDGIETLEDITAIFLVNSTSFDHYFRQWYGRGLPMMMGVQSSGVMLLMPYVQSGMVDGYLNSIRGAAELELLIGIPGSGVKRMDATSMMYVYSTVLTILAQFGLRRQDKEEI